MVSSIARNAELTELEIELYVQPLESAGTVSQEIGERAADVRIISMPLPVTVDA